MPTQNSVKDNKKLVLKIDNGFLSIIDNFDANTHQSAICIDIAPLAFPAVDLSAANYDKRRAMLDEMLDGLTKMLQQFSQASSSGITCLMVPNSRQNVKFLISLFDKELLEKPFVPNLKDTAEAESYLLDHMLKPALSRDFGDLTEKYQRTAQLLIFRLWQKIDPESDNDQSNRELKVADLPERFMEGQVGGFLEALRSQDFAMVESQMQKNPLLFCVDFQLPKDGAVREFPAVLMMQSAIDRNEIALNFLLAFFKRNANAIRQAEIPQFLTALNELCMQNLCEIATAFFEVGQDAWPTLSPSLRRRAATLGLVHLVELVSCVAEDGDDEDLLRIQRLERVKICHQAIVCLLQQSKSLNEERMFPVFDKLREAVKYIDRDDDKKMAVNESIIAIAFRHGHSVAALERFHKLVPAAIKRTNSLGQTLLHEAITNHQNYSYASIEFLVRRHPAAVTQADNEGNTPFSLIQRSLEVQKLENDAANMKLLGDIEHIMIQAFQKQEGSDEETD